MLEDDDDDNNDENPFFVKDEDGDDEDDEDDFLGCSSFDFSVSVLFDMANGERSTLKIDVLWANTFAESARYDIVSKWIPCEESLYTAIIRQSDDIYNYLRDVCGICNIEFCDKNGYRRNDFCWVPKSSPKSVVGHSFAEIVIGDCVAEAGGSSISSSSSMMVGTVVRKRGRPTGKRDSTKRIRSVSLSSESYDWCLITIVKLLYICGSELSGGALVVNKKTYEPTIAALFTLTDIFPMWHASKIDPIERRIYHMFGELQPALDDNPLFLKNFSDSFLESVTLETAAACKRFKFRIEEWLEMGGKCDFLRGPASESPTDGWEKFNKSELIAFGVENFQMIIISEKCKKRGLETIYLPPSKNAGNVRLGGSWEEIQDQFLMYKSRVKDEVDEYYKVCFLYTVFLVLLSLF